jgi:hypothetical protein
VFKNYVMGSVYDMGSVQDVLHFGKYKGKTILEVYNINRGYLTWMLANTRMLGPYLPDGSYYEFPFGMMKKYGYNPPLWVIKKYRKGQQEAEKSNQEREIGESDIDDYINEQKEIDQLNRELGGEIGENGYWNLD